MRNLVESINTPSRAFALDAFKKDQWDRPKKDQWDRPNDAVWSADVERRKHGIMAKWFRAWGEPTIDDYHLECVKRVLEACRWWNARNGRGQITFQGLHTVVAC